MPFTPSFLYPIAVSPSLPAPVLINVTLLVTTANSKSPITTLDGLPPEILCIVGEYLHPWDLSALVRTAKRFNVVLVPILMKKALRDITIGWEDRKTILDWVIFEDHLEMATMLLHLVKMEKRLPKRKIYKSALEYSAQRGYLDIVKIIPKDSVHVLNISTDGTEALNNTVVSQFPEIYTLLADAGATAEGPVEDIPPSGLDIRTIHAAACWGRIDLLRFLLSHGASLDEPEEYSLWRPLHYAAFHGQALTVEFLLDNEANAVERNKEWDPPNWCSEEFKKRTVTFSASYKRIIRLFLNQGLELSQRDNYQFTVLHLAAANGNAELVEHLLSLGADLTFRDFRARTPLHHAISNHHTKVVEILLAAGASLTATNYEGACAIHIAAAVGYPSVAFSKLLAIKGADPLALDNNGWTPLQHAANGGFFNTLRFLLEVTDSKFTLPDNKPLTLQGAVTNNDVDMVQYLLEAGVDVSSVEQRSFPKLPPLYIAVKAGYENIVELLLNHGADPNQKHEGEDSPLTCAIYRGATRIVRMLLSKGADTSGKENISEENEETSPTPPLIAAATIWHLDLVTLLLDQGADINIRSKNNCSVLEAVAFSECESRLQCELMVRLLLERGIDTSLRSRHGGSSLSPFCLLGAQDNTIKLLAEAGADIKSQDRFGNTLLHDLARRRYDAKPFSADIFRYLVDKGANASLVNKSLLTPLHMACAGILDYDLQPLFEAGIDPASQDIRGWTALHYAAWGGHFLQLSQLIRALKKHALREDSSSGCVTVFNGSKPPGATSSYVQSVLNLKDVHGWTALHLAVSESPLNFGNYMDGLGDLYMYCSGLIPEPQESYEIVRLLLESGVDPSITNEAGQTPLDLAELENPKDSSYEERELNMRESLLWLARAGAQRGSELVTETHNPQTIIESMENMDVSLWDRPVSPGPWEWELDDVDRTEPRW